MKKILIAGLFSATSLFLLPGCTDSDSSTPFPDSDPPAAANINLGGLVWENYTKTDAGGTGDLPAASTSADFVRCKACHGWDGKGLAGGYVRRSAKATRPNPTAVIGDISSKTGAVVLDDVWHNGNSGILGRAFGTEDQSMPDYSQAGGLTAEQVDNVVAFLNSGEKLTTFADFDIMPKPVGYSFKASTDVATGATLYANNCAGCHGADGLNATVSGVTLDAYFSGDGKYSEGFHKIVYGISNTIMTRSNSGSLTGQQAADILAFIQDSIAPNYYKGGLVWENYTKTDAGGSGTSPSPTSADFVRCKACHGWDGLGLDGGYVRRSTGGGTRPNPEPIIGNLSAKMGAPGIVGTVVAAEVVHDGTAASGILGRAFATEDQSMPDYSQAGGLTAKQIADAVAFLNSGPKVTDHATMDVDANPVAYTFTGTSAADGATLYAANCAGCHGADGADRIDQPTGGLGAYFAKDGKYSEGFHKIVYGISNTIMTRKASGNLTSQEAGDILTYIQANLGTTFP